MSLNYSKALAYDTNGVAIQLGGVPFKPNAVYSTNNATVSSVITLSDNSTGVEVAAMGAAVVIRWVPKTETAAVSPFGSVITTAGATANFDYVVAKDTVRRFTSPIENAGVASVVGLGVQVGSYRRLAVMGAATVSSILVSEF